MNEGKKSKVEEVKINNFNLFEDAGSKEYYKKNPKEKEMYIKPPVPRNRRKSTVDIKCSNCNKQFSVSPIFLRESDEAEVTKIYTCDRCLVKLRRGRV